MHKLLSEANPMPLEAGERYYVVSMEWFLQWKHYTDYKNSTETTPDGDTPMGTENGDKVVGKPGTLEAHPGIINNQEQIEKL